MFNLFGALFAAKRNTNPSKSHPNEKRLQTERHTRLTLTKFINTR